MSAKRKAEELAKLLFRNGAGKQAARLKLVDAEGNDLGGWGFSVIVDLAEDAFRAAIKEDREALIRSIQARGYS